MPVDIHVHVRQGSWLDKTMASTFVVLYTNTYYSASVGVKRTNVLATIHTRTLNNNITQGVPKAYKIL